MERGGFFLFLAASVFLGFNPIQAWKDEGQVIHVGGKVMCQDCTQGWNEWVHGSRPIKGCKVSIMCMDKQTVVFYARDETDEEGEFELKVNKSIDGKELKAAGCLVRLISSPDPQCNILTNFSGGQTGVKLGQPTRVFRDLVKYTLGTFYYTSPMCDEPDTSETPTQGRNY
ncbi:hypothetical protein AAC387_Pa02g0495 [Persea americana]